MSYFMIVDDVGKEVYYNICVKKIKQGIKVKNGLRTFKMRGSGLPGSNGFRSLPGPGRRRAS
jgi:hypothetical protein